ncbi:MAG: SGNH/GDSL hydrolase family protein, partial [Spirochaetia bacterium]|nr:SGNH/GDSL hydrolase family protein [Spirochaetia bacterium]
HFNFGLHDLKYLDEKKQYVTPDKGKQVATPEVYEKNLRDFVAVLKKTGAVLVWGSTTPVPDGSPGRVKGDELVYNKTAKRVMEENGVLIDDLYAALGDRISELQKPNNVHFTDEGSKVLATSAVASIREALKRPASTPEPAASPYATDFRLSSPVVEKVSSESLYIMATIPLPKGILFKPGLALEAGAELEASSDPVSLNAQILSADGKMSSFPFRGAEKSKRATGKLEIPESPTLHASSKSKEPWKEGDVIKQIRIYFTLPSKAAATIKVTSLVLGPK